jgi:hypothetical protein
MSVETLPTESSTSSELPTAEVTGCCDEGDGEAIEGREASRVGAGPGVVAAVAVEVAPLGPGGVGVVSPGLTGPELDADAFGATGAGSVFLSVTLSVVVATEGLEFTAGRAERAAADAVATDEAVDWGSNVGVDAEAGEGLRSARASAMPKTTANKMPYPTHRAVNK